MSIKEYISGNWLTPDTLKELKTSRVVIVGKPQINPDTPFGRDVLEMEVECKGQRFVYSMNRTSAREVAKTYGEEEEAWLGKTLLFDVVKQNVKGQLKDVMYAKAGDTPGAEELPEA